MTFGILNTRLGKGRAKTIRILFDSGSSGTLLKACYAKKLRVKQSQQTRWTTAAGSFTTASKAAIDFLMPEFHESRLISYKVSLIEGDCPYDMILGRDLLEKLKINLKFDTQSVMWDEVEVPMKPNDATISDAYVTQDSESMLDATERIKKILDAKYEPTTVAEIVLQCEHLTLDEKESLAHMLEKHRSLFDGKLGKWEGETYDIELNADATPYHARPFPIQKAYSL